MSRRRRPSCLARRARCSRPATARAPRTRRTSAGRELLPGLTTRYDPSSENDCTAGRTRCVDAVIREMRRRFDPLARACDHDSIFALVLPAHDRGVPAHDRGPDLLRGHARSSTTRTPSSPAATSTPSTPGTQGAARRRPPAWAIAFQAAADRAVTGQRQPRRSASTPTSSATCRSRSPAIGLVKPDGSSRKPDHDRVNVFLNRVTDDALRRDRAPLRPDDRRRRPARAPADDFARVPDHPDLARDRVAQRRAAGERPDAGGARAGRGQHRGLRRLAGRDDPPHAGYRRCSAAARRATRTAPRTTADAHGATRCPAPAQPEPAVVVGLEGELELAVERRLVVAEQVDQPRPRRRARSVASRRAPAEVVHGDHRRPVPVGCGGRTPARSPASSSVSSPQPSSGHSRRRRISRSIQLSSESGSRRWRATLTRAGPERPSVDERPAAGVVARSRSRRAGSADHCIGERTL